jgi:cytochrome c oxidase subunit 2
MIRSEKSKQLIAEGKPGLDSYTFDYLLLCNKICGASHYNMQMKIVVEEEDSFNKWLSTKDNLIKVIKNSQEPVAAPVETTTVVVDTALVAKVTDTVKINK